MHYFLPQLKKKEKHSTHSQWCGLRKWCYGKYRQTCNQPSSSSSYTVSLHYEETTNRIVLNAFDQIYLLSIYPKTRNRYTHTHTHRSPFASFICCWCFFLFVHFSYAFFGCCCLDLRMFVCVVCVCDYFAHDPTLLRHVYVFARCSRFRGFDSAGNLYAGQPAPLCLSPNNHRRCRLLLLSPRVSVIQKICFVLYLRVYHKYNLLYIFVFMVDWCTGSYP